MTLKLYYDLLSQPSRALYILLKQSKIPFETCPVSLGKGEHLTDEFKSISKFQKVPAISDDGFNLIESVAILRYLSGVKQLPEQWYSRDPIKQARIDEYLEWQHQNTRLLCSLYFQRKWLFPLRGVVTPPEKLAVYEKNMSDCLDSIENVWLKPGPFIAGNEMTVADLWAACEIEQPRLGGYDVRKGRPAMAAWLDKVRAAASPHYGEAHTLLDRLAEKAKAKAKL